LSLGERVGHAGRLSFLAFWRILNGLTVLNASSPCQFFCDDFLKKKRDPLEVAAMSAQLIVLAAGLAAMRAAVEHGDFDEAARQGSLAGPAVVERALASQDRTTQLAGIAAAAIVEDRLELLPALARVAGGPDRRTAIPAARAARDIARELARSRARGKQGDEIAGEDLAGWRTAWVELAMRGDRFIEVRVIALDTAASLAASEGAGDVGFELAAALGDGDPAVRREAVAVVPVPVPAAARPALANAVASDKDAGVALGAAQALCGDLAGDAPEPVLAALGAAGLARIRALVVEPHAPAGAVVAAARCLAADRSPDSAATLRALGRGRKR
jgi:hypothetical protein